MNRSKFLKSIGLGALAVIVAPKIIAEVIPEPIEDIPLFRPNIDAVIKAVRPDITPMPYKQSHAFSYRLHMKEVEKATEFPHISHGWITYRDNEYGDMTLRNRPLFDTSKFEVTPDSFHLIKHSDL